MQQKGTLTNGKEIIISLEEKDINYFHNALNYEKNMVGRAYPAGCKNAIDLIKRYLDKNEIKYKIEEVR